MDCIVHGVTKSPTGLRDFTSLHTYVWAYLVAQMVKYPPAIQETWVRSLGMAAQSRTLRVENPHGQRSLVFSRDPCMVQDILACYLSYVK